MSGIATLFLYPVGYYPLYDLQSFPRLNNKRQRLRRANLDSIVQTGHANNIVQDADVKDYCFSTRLHAFRDPLYQRCLCFFACFCFCLFVFCLFLLICFVQGKDLLSLSCKRYSTRVYMYNVRSTKGQVLCFLVSCNNIKQASSENKQVTLVR